MAAQVTGWIVLAVIAAAALVPLLARATSGKRGGPSSSPIRLHVWLGLLTVLTALGHTLLTAGDLGTERAIEGGMLALAPGVAAFFVLFAHVGVGLQLRNPKLRDRSAKRRTHAITASLIALASVAHVLALIFAGH